MNSAFTWVFLAALALATGTRLWLAARQARHVRAHREAVPEAFASTIPLAAHQKAADYTVAKIRLAVAELVADAVMLLLLTLGGWLQAVASLFERLFEYGSLAHGTAVVFSVIALTSIAGIPFEIYRTFSLEQRFGFNRMTWRLYVIDSLKSIALGLALGIPLILAVLWLMSASGPFWWLLVWLLVTVYLAFLQFIGPRFILPIFNKFSPIDDPNLGQRIQRLLDRCGYRSNGLFVMDNSKRSEHGNAFFTGFGATKRIVLFDTLVKRLLPSEVEAVLAHELGHFKLRHIVQSMVIGWVTTLGLLYLLGLLVDQPWFFSGLGVERPSFAIALILFLLVMPTFLFFIGPIAKIRSRANEFAADRFAMEHADARDLASALVKMYRDNSSTLTPDPIHSAFYDSHPPAATRIARLRTA